MNSLLEVIQEPNRREAVIKDAVTLVDEQVKQQRGATGFAIKAAYGAMSKLRGGRMIPAAVSALIDDFAQAIEPLHETYRKSNSPSFQQYLEKNDEQAADALLGITDRRISAASSIVAKTYKRLRPTAKKQVAKAAGDIGALIDRHTSSLS